jgi:S-methylmethionine-dependent homocysteine/selenocysteine methylase
MMPRYRNQLPQLSDNIFLTDGGLETTLVFHDKIDLPLFAAFDLLRSKEGRGRIERYYELYAGIARARGLGFVLESPTWRANPAWAARLGYGRGALAEINREAIGMMVRVRDRFETESSPMVVSGCLGPRGDGYEPGRLMSVREAQAYHSEQIEAFRDSEADMISAMTLNYVEEAVGIAQAARSAGMPVAISFTVETDGRLPTGMTLEDAILSVDRETARAPAYYMVNCAHPTHFEALLDGSEWTARVRGLRANASKRSHAELDAALDLDDGDPVDLGRSYRALRMRLPRLTVLGGCCGTDHRHVEQIALSCDPVSAEGNLVFV